MTEPAAAVPIGSHSVRERAAAFLRNLPLRLGQREFWITQIAVLGVTAGHILAEIWISGNDLAIPSAFHHIPVVLYLGPISYASLRFGTEGALLTGLWSGLLTIPNLLIWHRADYEWLEFLYVALVLGAGIIISIPVERERRQRRHAEATSQRMVMLNEIATLTLTADLRTTLDQTLRRLLEVLDLEAACVVVDDLPESSRSPTVLACRPETDIDDWLSAHLSERSGDVGRPAAGPGPSVVALPLAADLSESRPEGRVNGLLAAKVKPTRHLTQEDHRLLAGVASHIAVAIANERLTQSEHERLRSFAISVIRAQEEERKRIARELHDEASQNVVVIRRGLAALADSLYDHPAAAELGGLRNLAAQTVAGMRRFSRDLRPPTLDALGLSSALDQLFTEVRQRTSLAGAFRVTGKPRRLPIETELTLFRIGQAALHNVERHADAARVDVELVFDPTRIRMTITDDGRGFDAPEDLADLAHSGRLGIIGMQERAELAGGLLHIESRPGMGTRVVLEVPGLTYALQDAGGSATQRGSP